MLRYWILSIGWLVLTAIPTYADDYNWASNDYNYASGIMNDFTDRFHWSLVDPVKKGVRRRAPRKGTKARPLKPTTVSPRIAKVPAAMAATYPADQRDQAKQTFEQLLTGYQQIEKQFGIKHYDVAGAMAALIAASYMGYHDKDFPDKYFKPLVKQMQRIIGGNAKFSKIPEADKQEMYEQLAILGMLVASTQMELAKKPDAQRAAAMQKAAKGYLEKILKTDAKRVQLTAKGIVIR